LVPVKLDWESAWKFSRSPPSHYGRLKKEIRSHTGERSAVIYTLIESAKRHGHEPYAYLKDVLERLPSLKASDIESLLPANWQTAGQAIAPSQIAG
jgi:hypothetical protein